MKNLKSIGLFAFSLALVGAGCNQGVVFNSASFGVTDEIVEVGDNGYLDDVVEVGGVNTLVSPADLESDGQGIDGMPPLNDPDFLSIEDAERVMNDEFEIGFITDLHGFVVNDGDSFKFYPYQILSWHQVVNDTVNDEPVVISYGELSSNGGVFSRRLSSGETAEFGNAGFVWNNSNIMYDKGTDSLWSSLLEKSIYGELAGEKLNKVDYSVMTYADFKSSHPDGLILSPDTGFERMYSRSPFGSYLLDKTIYFDFTHNIVRAFDPKEYIVGIEIDGVAKAYSVSSLDELEEDGLDDEINGVKIHVYKKDGAWVFEKENGEFVDSDVMFWMIWSLIHSNSEVYGFVQGVGFVNGVLELGEDKGVDLNDDALHININPLEESE